MEYNKKNYIINRDCHCQNLIQNYFQESCYWLAGLSGLNISKVSSSGQSQGREADPSSPSGSTLSDFIHKGQTKPVPEPTVSLGNHHRFIKIKKKKSPLPFPLQPTRPA